jgi:hypothetical protein
MRRQPLVVHDPAALRRLSVWRGFGPQGHPPVKLAAEGVAPKQVEEWERRLNRQLYACGCDTAAIGLAASLLAYLVWLVARPQGLAGLQWGDLWLGLAVVIPATLAGKAVGLWAAQRELASTVMRIAREWKVPPPPPPEPSACG